MTDKVGNALRQPIVGRGAAYLDFENDGDLDLVISTSNGPAKLLRNDNGNQNDVLKVKTIGTWSNRDGIGAKIYRENQQRAKTICHGERWIKLSFAKRIAAHLRPG